MTTPEQHRRYNTSAKGRSRRARYQTSSKGHLKRVQLRTLSYWQGKVTHG